MRGRDRHGLLWGSPGFVVSAIGVAVLVIAAIVITVISIGGDHGPAAPRHATAREAPYSMHASGGARPSGGDPRGCDLRPVVQTVPVSAPSSNWTLVGVMAAPTAPATFGPEKVQGGLRAVFAHDPTGALFALASFFAESTRIPQAQLFTRLAADTPARTVAVAQAQCDGQLLQSEDGDPGTVSIAGFQYVDYTPAQASISLVLEGPSGELAALPCSLEWQHGDWRFVIPPSQQLAASVVSSMDGFIAWSAVNS